MTRIGTIQTSGARDFSPVKMEVKQSSRLLERSDSMESAKKNKITCGNLMLVVLKPFTFIGWIFTATIRWISSWILPCCIYTPTDEKLKFARIRSLFDGIYQNVVTSRDSMEVRQKQFDEIKQSLPNLATKKFKEHIGFVLASKEDAGIDRAKQIEWYGKNENMINFETHFKVGDPILKKAVINFNNELREKS